MGLHHVRIASTKGGYRVGLQCIAQKSMLEPRANC
jgi:hypothetical protein